ncbi:MAG: sensor histidine kinase [Longimicrobiales bacterium]
MGVYDAPSAEHDPRDDLLTLKARIDVMTHSMRGFAEEVVRVAELTLRNRTIELTRAKAEIATLHRELKRRTYELERAQTARGRFYDAMSHELRTPITAILGFSSLLNDSVYGPLNEPQARAVNRTRTAAEHLLELVNDLLDISKIEAGKIELRLEPLAFPNLLEELSATVRALAAAQGSALTTEHLGGPILIVSDARRVRQILLNLVSNAIRFGQGQPIQILSTAWAEHGIEIRVIDHGVGILPIDLEKIFDEFAQFSPGHPADPGLGLPISRRLATQLNGSLSVSSVPGQGTTFRLRLPRMPDLVDGVGPALSHAESAA